MYSDITSNNHTPKNSNFSAHSALKNSPNNIWLNAGRNEFFLKIAAFLEEVAFSAGDYIHQPHDAADYVYFPETAIVSEFQILRDGRAVGVFLHGNESILGLDAIFDANPADYWSQVLLSGKAYRIKAEIFKECVLQNPTFQTLICEYLNNHIRQLTQKVVCNSYHTLEERFCSLLLMLRYYRKSCDLSITHEQIAYFLGTHRPSITQIAQTLRGKEIISYVRGMITIFDGAKLENSACDCYAGIKNK